jgi:uncharacterized protein (TIGR03663 family)
VRDGLGRAATFWAGLFTAVSTAFVYYSRYYIHEVPLVFFAFLFGAAVWRYWRRPSGGWAALAGVALGLLHATKETFVFNVAALFVAVVLAFWFAPDARAVWRDLSSRIRGSHVALAVGLALATSLVLFSSCFTNREGPLDSVRTYAAWLSRAGGESAHVHPWSFYLERVFWFHPAKGQVFTEGLIGLLALVGMVTAFLPKGQAPEERQFTRFLATYVLALVAAYSAVAYKTPWCALGFLHGAILLAGVGAAALLRWIRPTWLWLLVLAGLLAGSGHLAWQARRATGEFATDQRNPYVYAHTSKDFLRLVNRVLGVARMANDPYAVPINVMAPGGDYWPWPWYLRGFKEVSWSPGVPEDPFAPIVVAGARLNAALDEKSEKRWLSAGYYEHRPKVFFELFVELELWKRYVETLPRDRDED